MVDSANAFPAGDSEFSETGLTPMPSVKIAAPRVKEVPIHFECKLERVLELGPNRHPLVIGEVVYMHIDPSCMTIGNIISGLVGGGVLGQIVTLALPSVVAAAQSGNLSVGGVVSQVIAGGAGGAILTAIVGAIKNKAMA